jgi:DNA-binding winged helix-turn-helix (wHTH) protein/Tol biopolymer transport system component
MSGIHSPRPIISFGPFEADLQTQEVKKHGIRLHLPGQSFQILKILLERPGELVTREELNQALWPTDTFVDYGHGVNAAVNRLREALGDSAENPQLIETLHRRGYRFIGTITKPESVAGEVAQISGESSAPSQVEDGPDTSGQTAALKRWRWKLAVAIMLVAVGALYWFYRPRTPVVTSIHQLTRTGHHKSTALFHHPVTDGTRVYFDEWFGDRWHLAQVATQGGEVSYIEMPLIKNPTISDISDDGSQLLVPDVTAKFEDPAWVFSLPNGPTRKIPGRDVALPVFLPRSNQIAYLLSSDPTHLFTSQLDGSNAHPMFAAPGPISSFAISPDGQRARFSVDGKMWESRLDGSELHRLLPQRKEPISRGQWSPDGRIYTFLSYDKDGPNLWAVTESTLGPYRLSSRPTQLTFGAALYRFWATSKDGKQIYALGETRHGELNVYDGTSGLFGNYLKGISAGFVDFSRDGQWVTYVAYPEATLWRSRVDGSERLQLTFPPMGAILNPKWSPDGRLIVFMEWGSSGRKIYLVPAEGGVPVLLVGGDYLPSDPTWSPDGKSIAYGGGVITGKSDIRILNLDTMQSATIPGSKGVFSPRWSPDGHYIAALSIDSTKLLLHNVTRSRWTQMPLTKVGMEGVGWPMWSHDSRYLYVMRNEKILKLRVPDGREELAASVDFEVTCPVFLQGWFGLTPDDRVIVLRDRGTDELYALDLDYR